MKQNNTLQANITHRVNTNLRIMQHANNNKRNTIKVEAILKVKTQ